MNVVIDCGGTSSRTALIVDGVVRARFRGDASLSGCLEPMRIAPMLRELLAPVESRCRRDGLTAPGIRVVIAAAGFVDSLRAEYRAAAESVGADAFDGAIGTLTLVNDAVALLLGHDADGVVVAGTGSAVLVRTADGGVVQRGGHDWVAADEGAAFWIGLEGIRRVKRDLEDGVDSPLRAAFRRIHAVDDAGMAGAFRDLAIAGPQMKARIARFAVGVCDAAADGDGVALAIVDRQVGELADTVARAVAAAGPLSNGALRMVASGGMMSDEFYRRSCRERVRARIGDVDWITVDDGLTAAAAMAEQTAEWPAALGPCRPLVVVR